MNFSGLEDFECRYPWGVNHDGQWGRGGAVEGPIHTCLPHIPAGSPVPRVAEWLFLCH